MIRINVKFGCFIDKIDPFSAVLTIYPLTGLVHIHIQGYFEYITNNKKILKM